MRRMAMVPTLLMVILGACGGSAADPLDTAGPDTTALQSTSENPPPTAASTPSTQPQEPVEVAIARASMDTWNSGDIEAYLGFFAEDAQFYKWPMSDEHIRPGLDFWAALGDEVVIDDCEVLSDGRVLCHCFSTDDLSRAAGVVAESNWSFWVTDGLITKAGPAGLNMDRFWFMKDMQRWLENAHPDVWASDFAQPELCTEEDEYDCMESWRLSSHTATALLEYGSEFIEASEKYPLSD